jgi:hypothetical protein
MKRIYALFWISVFAVMVSGFGWAQWGDVWLRKHFLLPIPVPESARTESHFLALAFPRITEETEPFTFGQTDFEAILQGLKKLGYTPIGFDDIRDFYSRQRLLPPHAVLIALDRDERQSSRLADQSLRKLRLRGAVFVASGEDRKGPMERHWLSRHAIAQMRNSGAWDFGTGVSKEPGQPAQEFAFSTRNGEFRFHPGLTGFNDDRNAPDALNILRMRSDHSVAETIIMIHGDQPRRQEFVDQFASPRLGFQWISEWGAASTARHHLLILPTPRQTGATVFLLGTEAWRDMEVEFKLERFTKTFWAFARYKDAEHYVRFAATEEGYWTVQQKRGPLSPPSLLGRTRRREGSLPARVRLVVKEDAALLYINGILQFGKPLRVDPGIDRGRIELGVYSPEFHAAKAAVDYVRARPLGTKWIALSAPDLSAPGFLDLLRAEAVEANAISPRWLKVQSNGTISSLGRDREIIWSFAGFYRCRLIPQVDLSSWTPDAGGSPAAWQALAAGLAEKADSLQGGGLNLLISAGSGGPPAGFLETLRAKLRSQKRELWVTSAGELDPSLSTAVDGQLRHMSRPVSGFDILEAGSTSAGPSSSAAGSEVASWR